MRKSMGLLLLLAMPVSAADELLEVFTLREEFGISHRLQTFDIPFTFTTNDWSSVFLTKSNTLVNVELAFQPSSTGTVFVADSLAARSTNWYRLYRGHATTATPLISVNTNTAYYEITNSMIGVRVLRSGATLATNRAPIQGVRSRTGTWFSTNETDVTVGPWLYRWRTDATMDTRDTNRLTSSNLVTTVVESGPVLFQVKNVYLFARPAYTYGSLFSVPAGSGYLTNTVTLMAEMPTPIMYDSTDMELWYGMHIESVLTPDRRRYRGHGASQAAFGYDEGTGLRYIQPNVGSNYDGTVDISVADNTIPSDSTTLGPNPKRLTKMLPWNRFGDDNGHYQQVFASGGAATSPVLGAFTGRASLADKMVASGVSWYSKASTRWGFVVAYRHRADDNSFSTNHVSQWGLFIDQKSNLPAYNAFQPIGMYQNLIAGFNLSKVCRYVLDFTDRSDGYYHLFMSPSIVTNNILSPLRNPATAVSAYNAFVAAEPSFDLGYLFIRENVNGQYHTQMVNTVFNLTSNLFESLINGDGVHDNDNGGMRAGMQALDSLAYIDLILGDQHSTTEQKRKARIAGAALGYMLWDNDFTPLDGDAQVPLGTPNQILQYNANRNSFAFEFPNHVYFSNRVQFATNNVIELIQAAYNTAGAAAETPHYIEAAFGPLIQNCLQLQQTPGALDPFVVESQRLTNLARMYLHMLTPTEVRFGNQFRKRVTWGDGSVEGTWVPGALATGLRSVDNNLASQLLGAWKAMGNVHSEQFITTILSINDTASTNTWSLSHENFPGGMSAMHVSYGTTNESSAWLPNGTWYNDHRHQQDWGSFHAYALGAPLAIHPGPLYTPRVDRQQMQNAVSFETFYASPWNGGQPITSSTTSGSFTSSATNQNFVAFTSSGWTDAFLSDSSGRTWRRTVRLIGPNAQIPVYHINDEFSENGVSRIVNLQFASEANSVSTPVGNYTVSVGDYPSLPPGGTIITLTNGVRTMTFTGGTWVQHPSQGINWIWAINTSEHKYACMGAWGNFWNNDREQTQYRTANSVGTYRERLTQLRVRGSNDFNHLLIPYRKNAFVSGLTVFTNGTSWHIDNTNHYWRISTNTWAYNHGTTRRALAVWSGIDSVSDTNGLAIVGGPAEVDLKATNTVFSMHGNAGKRTFTLPSNFRTANPPNLFSRADVVIHYSGGTPKEVSIQ